MHHEPPVSDSTERLREAAKARGRAIRRRHRLWSAAAVATVIALALGGGLVAAMPSSHSPTHLYVSGAPPKPGESTTSTSAATSGKSSPGTTVGTTNQTPPPDRSVSPVPPATTTPAPASTTACSSSQVSISARADRSSYTWNDPITLTVTLSLVGLTPCLVDRANGGGWHNLGCYPSFLLKDASAGLVGPWVAPCETANFQPHLLTAQSPDVVDVSGALNCQADIDNPCTSPSAGTRPWNVTVTWMWDAPAAPPPYAQANVVFAVEVTEPRQPTTTTTPASPGTPTTTTPPTTGNPSPTTTVSTTP